MLKHHGKGEGNDDNHASSPDVMPSDMYKVSEFWKSFTVPTCGKIVEFISANQPFDVVCTSYMCDEASLNISLQSNNAWETFVAEGDMFKVMPLSCPWKFPADTCPTRKCCSNHVGAHCPHKTSLLCVLSLLGRNGSLSFPCQSQTTSFLYKTDWGYKWCQIVTFNMKISFQLTQNCF